MKTGFDIQVHELVRIIAPEFINHPMWNRRLFVVRHIHKGKAWIAQDNASDGFIFPLNALGAVGYLREDFPEHDERVVLTPSKVSRRS